MSKVLFTTILLFFSQLLVGQIKETEIGQWQEHVPYYKSNSVSANGPIIYCGSEAGFIAYNMDSKEVKRYSTISGLSDIGVKSLKFNDKTKALLVAYKNGNLDILENGRIINISAIKDETDITADKSINNIRMEEELAYLSTGFGIVVLNMERKEIKDTYFIGEESKPLVVFDVVIHPEENMLYAATERGIRRASLDDNLSDYNSWTKLDFLPNPDSTYNHIDYFANKLIVNQLTGVYDSDITYTMSDTMVEVFLDLGTGGTNDFEVHEDRMIVSKLYNIFIYDTDLKRKGLIYSYEDGMVPTPRGCIRHKGYYWIADRVLGLGKWFDVGQYELIAPDGPNTLSIHDVDVQKGVLWTTSGIMDPSYRGSPNLPEFNRLQNLTWTGINRGNEPKLDSLYGLIKVVINPQNTDQVFFASWDNGLLEIQNGEVYRNYNDHNKDLYNHELTPLEGTDIVRIGGLAFDNEGNLWITNSETPWALCVFKKDGSWRRFDLSQYIDGNTIVGDLIITPNGDKWIALNRASANYRIVVFDDNGTIDNIFDDRVTALSTDVGRGSIPGSTLHSISQDKGGAIWIGTDEGPAVFYSPNFVFDSQQEAQQILVEQDGQTQILLETENIKSVTVDGADRKWFATSNSGAFLMSSDATKEVNHFTVENSPLFSDEVNAITINHDNGEVYFCTSEGLISYKGTATEGGSNFSTVEVFPNPVERGYSGNIAIKGLAENANVKITDINGVLIYETNADGGQAIWDGNSIRGSKARNGVYLIFCTDVTGEFQEVTKLLYLNN